MKRLAVLRHANAGWPDGVGDFDRPLSERGREEASRIRSEIERRELRFELVLASTARRVRETLDVVGEALGNAPIHFSDELYLASENLLVDRVRSATSEASSILLVGHNPGLERLVADLARDDESGIRNRVIAGFPTAALALLELPVDGWAEVRRGTAGLLDLIQPRELD